MQTTRRRTHQANTVAITRDGHRAAFFAGPGYPQKVLRIGGTLKIAGPSQTWDIHISFDKFGAK